ncbi:cobalt-precorrin-5B (C(1))-methyltransferase CbiD [Thermoleptolyngbya sp. C42_A2020_037]|uniref:cobalt-precorrin-5B (C(1))-methyltransferase CbiD n=1 Tax=Thermoleptolyngbya sp. C42_A2020_037 TaxID=2747799 RepID=UPI0019D9F089|nr:cobalt-precorrin-5B (C(1))-methyltransferase CbiD [Thermoleptolyngbya sp. C42_A2020_037]MBF2085255.1 cobalt-precorrin-5B (C(1))-methyltransferase [Thermoleptolyngbya sp. C42_A2020_037]
MTAPFSENAASRAGYTLPVFACAGAIAALRHLHDDPPSPHSVTLDLINPAQVVEIPIEQVARLGPTTALAITRSDPGDNLDLTRNTPIWSIVEIRQRGSGVGKQDFPLPAITLEGGEGLGRQVNAENQPAIYAYARTLLLSNLEPLLHPGEAIGVTIVLPEGRSLATRTSNAAFGVVEGLSLLGTSGISQPLSAPGQLENFRAALRQKSATHSALVFCLGENGLDLASNLGIDPGCVVKTANWLGPLLVEAGMQGVESILLFGYHGKLMKLAGGIFHTHHHVADGRQEIFAAHCAIAGLPTSDVQRIFACDTAEAALKYLQALDANTGSNWVGQVYGAIAQTIDQRSAEYIRAHSDRSVQVGSVLFGRDRQIIAKSELGSAILSQVLLS